MNTGDRIKQRRLELGLTADDLADRINKSRATIYRYENGDIENMPTTILEPLAKALETTPADLMGWNNETQDKSNNTLDEIISMLPDKLARHTYTYSKLTNTNQSLVDEYTNKVLEVQSMTDNIAVAAHERTDIEVTADMIKHDDDIMNDDNF